MNYSIIGSGAIGSALATHFARVGIDVLVANRRGPDSLAELAGKLGPRIIPVTVQEALQADVVILALPFQAVAETLQNVRSWDGRIVVDATNAIDFPDFRPTDLGGRLSSEVIASTVPGARLVKAFNTLPAAVLAADPAANGGRRVLFVSGDDAAAVADVSGLIGRLGFAAIALGTIAAGGRLQQFGEPLVLQKLVKQA
jgi:predicted dinucleotide-binding enzyme